MRCALYQICAGLGNRQHIVLVDLAFELFGAFRDHILDGFDIMSFVHRNKGDRVAGIGLDIGRLENHGALGALVEHMNFDIFGKSGGSQHGEDACGSKFDRDVTHFVLISNDWRTCRLGLNTPRNGV